MRRLPASAPALVGLCLSALAVPAQAQLPDLVDANALYLPGAALADPRSTQAQVTFYDASVNVPMALGEKAFLIPGVGYHADSVSFADTPPGFVQLRAFHSVDLPLLCVQLLPNDWALSFRVAPGVAGDFQGFDSRLVRVSAMALATHSFSERLVLGGGALGSYSFGSFLPLPAIYLSWRPTDWLRIETFVPSFLSAKYTIGDRFEIGLRANVTGNSYAVRDRRITGAWPCAAGVDDPSTPQNEAQADRSQCLDHVAYSMVTVGPEIGIRVVDSIWWTTSAGRSLFRRFERQNRDNGPVGGGAQDLPDEIFVRAGLTWRMPQ